MKNKGKLFSIVVLLSLSLLAISTNVFGQITYTCEVKEEDEFIFTVTTLHAEEYGFLEQLSVGDKMKIKITDITEETDYFDVEYDEWAMISKGESFSSTADSNSWEDVYKDPSDPEALLELSYFVLTPVSDYLAAFAEANSEEGYSSSGNKLTKSSYDSTSQIITTFDSNGVVSKDELKLGGTVVLVLSRGGDGSSIPGYDLPILIGLTTIAGVSIIYIVKKKMLK
ncbi:MAG: hypothetical protein CEE43_14765 [Promethearchaeota archaeon Loki_b32]|nr:MAG: hypothetical protein CEE43_14765 [Candidatus Lokiarchaeota archaeon Loki_b32]